MNKKHEKKRQLYLTESQIRAIANAARFQTSKIREELGNVSDSLQWYLIDDILELNEIASLCEKELGIKSREVVVSDKPAESAESADGAQDDGKSKKSRKKEGDAS